MLIIIPASGKGSFSASLAGVQAVLRGTASVAPRGDKDYLRVDRLNVDLKIRDVNMGIKRAFNNNAILSESQGHDDPVACPRIYRNIRFKLMVLTLHKACFPL